MANPVNFKGVSLQQRCSPAFSPIMAAVVAALMVAGCSADPVPAAVPDAPSSDPAGAALPLSIGGQVAEQGDDAMTVAVNCSAALGLTAERLASMTNDPRSSEIALIRRAEGYFADEAEAAASAGDGAAGSTGAVIARRRSEKSNEATEQAQLAIACLRRFGEEVSAQAGAAQQP